DKSALCCGVHSPFHRPSAKKLIQAGESPTVYHSNCSGKHAGMLAICLQQEYPLAGYYKPEHAVQKLILNNISNFTEISAQNVHIGIDGCGVPVFGLPLYNMALAYAKFTAPDRDKSVDRVVQAMVNKPFMVAGSGRICTDLMRVSKGTILAKTGAEGVYCAGLVDQGIGIALKVEDGAQRALAPVIVEALLQLGWLSSVQGEELANHHLIPLKNFHNVVIGNIRPAFQLN
ncbi:MAG: asparaginase, partial [Carboxydocellales bacterium]